MISVVIPVKDGGGDLVRCLDGIAGQELDEYKSLLKEGLWRPTSLELFVMNRDGSNQRQVTKLGGANFAPSWHPDGKRLIPFDTYNLFYRDDLERTVLGPLREAHV